MLKAYGDWLSNRLGEDPIGRLPHKADHSHPALRFVAAYVGKLPKQAEDLCRIFNLAEKVFSKSGGLMESCSCAGKSFASIMQPVGRLGMGVDLLIRNTRDRLVGEPDDRWTIYKVTDFVCPAILVAVSAMGLAAQGSARGWWHLESLLKYTPFSSVKQFNRWADIGGAAGAAVATWFSVQDFSFKCVWASRRQASAVGDADAAKLRAKAVSDGIAALKYSCDLAKGISTLFFAKRFGAEIGMMGAGFAVGQSLYNLWQGTPGK